MSNPNETAEEARQIEYLAKEGPKAVPASMQKIDIPIDRIFKIANSANVKDVAWSIVKALEEGYRPILVGIGVQAVSQAFKSVAIANSRIVAQGKMFLILPAFENALIPDVNPIATEGGKTAPLVERTLLKFILVPYRF